MYDVLTVVHLELLVGRESGRQHFRVDANLWRGKCGMSGFPPFCVSLSWSLAWCPGPGVAWSGLFSSPVVSRVCPVKLFGRSLGADPRTERLPSARYPQVWYWQCIVSGRYWSTLVLHSHFLAVRRGRISPFVHYRFSCLVQAVPRSSALRQTLVAKSGFSTMLQRQDLREVQPAEEQWSGAKKLGSSCRALSALSSQPWVVRVARGVLLSD